MRTCARCAGPAAPKPGWASSRAPRRSSTPWTRGSPSRTCAARLRAAGIRIGFFLQFGYPEEGWRDIELTRRLVRELAPDEIGISVSYPLPGTKFHERVRDRMGTKRNWTESDDLDPLFPGAFSRHFYQTLSRTVHAEFRTRRALRALRRLAVQPFA